VAGRRRLPADLIIASFEGEPESSKSRTSSLHPPPARARTGQERRQTILVRPSPVEDGQGMGSKDSGLAARYPGGAPGSSRSVDECGVGRLASGEAFR